MCIMLSATMLALIHIHSGCRADGQTSPGLVPASAIRANRSRYPRA